MIHAKTQEILSLLLSVQYTHSKNVEYDYSTKPRPCHNFVFMLEGEGIISAEGKNIPFKAGNILFIPQNTTYKSQWIANPKAVFHSLHFSFESKYDPLFNKNIPVQLLDNTNFNRLYFLLKDIEMYQFSKNSNSFFAISAFYSICGDLFRKIEIKNTKSMNKILFPAIKYIEQNYAKQFTVEELARICFLSSSRFYYLFKQQTGISPIAYKNKIAIQNAARELLYNKTLSIKEIAEKHGYTNIIYFERVFKKLIGKSPSQYRKEEILL